MSKYVYLNIYKEGFYYVGSHTWSGEGIDLKYKGSSHVAKRKNLHLERVIVLEWVPGEEKTLVRERYWINYFADRVGISTLVPPNSWTVKKPQNGLLINGHANDIVNARSRSESKEVRQKVERIKALRGRTGNGLKKRLEDTEGFKESSRKSIATRLANDPKALDSFREGSWRYLKEHPDYKFGERTVPFHNKGVKTRKNNGSYFTGAKKVAETIHGRKHFEVIPIKVVVLATGETKKFSSIKEAECWFTFNNEHITRATISQGLKRTQGNYTYKRKYKFSYEKEC